MNALRWLAVGVLLATLYPFAPWLPVPLGVAVAIKALATLTVLVAAAVSRAPGSPRLAVGLALHLVGDVLIELAPLPFAMAAFLAGHLVYLSLFLGWRLPWRRLGVGRPMLGALLVVDAAVLVALVVPRAGALAVPVVVYAVALLAMALAATAAEASVALPAGAAMFVLSDSLLSIHLFVTPLVHSTLLTWPTYWLAQALIAFAVVTRAEEPGASVAPAS